MNGLSVLGLILRGFSKLTRSNATWWLSIPLMWISAINFSSEVTIPKVGVEVPISMVSLALIGWRAKTGGRKTMKKDKIEALKAEAEQAKQNERDKLASNVMNRMREFMNGDEFRSIVRKALSDLDARDRKVEVTPQKNRVNDRKLVE